MEQFYFIHAMETIPGPHTVDLMPVCSITGTLVIAASILKRKTSQSNSTSEKAKSFGT